MDNTNRTDPRLQEHQRSFSFFVPAAERDCNSVFCLCHFMGDLLQRYQDFKRTEIFLFRRRLVLIPDTNSLRIPSYYDALATEKDRQTASLFRTVNVFQARTPDKGMTAFLKGRQSLGPFGQGDILRLINIYEWAVLEKLPMRAFIQRDIMAILRGIEKNGFVILSPHPYTQAFKIRATVELLVASRQFYPDAHAYWKSNLSRDQVSTYYPFADNGAEIYRATDTLPIQNDYYDTPRLRELTAPLFDVFETGDFLCVNQADGSSITPGMIRLGEHISDSVYQVDIYTTGDIHSFREEALLARRLAWFSNVGGNMVLSKAEANTSPEMVRLAATANIARIIEVHGVSSEGDKFTLGPRP